MMNQATDWEKTSFSCKSHPDKLLIEHLRNCAVFCKNGVSRLSFNETKLIRKSILANIACIVGFTHDTGKATSFFQAYLNEENPVKRKKLRSDQRTRHGTLSSVFTFALVKQYLTSLGEQHPYFDFLPFMAMIVVKRHHGSPDNFDKEIRFIDTESLKETKIITDQFKSIDQNEFRLMMDYVEKEAGNIRFSCDELFADPVKYIDGHIVSKAGKIHRKIKKLEDINLFIIQQLLYSLILQADKQDVIFGNDRKANRKEVTIDPLTEYRIARKFDKPGNPLDELRSGIYNGVIDNISNADLSNRIYSITVPTGLGKTLTALGCALSLRERITTLLGIAPNIIYSLPFTSIIEQNHQIFKEVFKSPDTDILLKHHHLADLYYKKDDDEMEPDQSAFLIEGWESEIVVTTFMQLFHSIFTRKNRMIRKFHKIFNSIVLLDEIQAIPHKYWLTVNRIFKALAEDWNTYFILLTATQPLIFDGQKGEIKEITSGNEEIYKQMDRVVLTNNSQESISREKFVEILIDDIETHNDQSFLIILNTIATCQKTYNDLKKHIPENYHLYYLSTGIIPKERLHRIQQIKADPCPKIVVSTQLVEAGVDIDLDRVYRDFAPLDCIAQSAGRCNRNNRKQGKGEIILVRLANEKNRDYCNFIYDRFLLEKTRMVLSNKVKFNENEFFRIISDYYLQISESGSDDVSISLLRSISEVQYETIDKDFRLIEEGRRKTDLFIEIDPNAESLWERAATVKALEDPFERKAKFREMKPEFYNYIISIDSDKSGKEEDPGMGVVRITLDELPYIYSLETGFILEDSTSMCL